MFAVITIACATFWLLTGIAFMKEGRELTYAGAVYFFIGLILIASVNL